MNYMERVGVLHVHSHYSDGSASIAEIVAAARPAGLDFLVLSDHDTLAARREGWEGTHEDVQVLVAVEITPAREGHVLAMNVGRCAGFAARPNRETLDAVATQGGYALVAHPSGKSKPALRIRQPPWYDWNHPAVRGMEIWSYLHDWIDGVVWWRLPMAYEFWKHPERRVQGPYPRILRLWDCLGRTRRVAGLSGLDCHARRVPLAGVRIFPYEKMFRAVRNHLFIEKARWEADPIGALWEAHSEGRGFVSHDVLADARGTRCWADVSDGRALQMGQETSHKPGARIRLRLPRVARVRWIVNGECRLSRTADALDLEVSGPGIYRFEATLDGAPWLFTNPFYFR